MRLSDIYRNQNNDILLRSGDVITAYESREFLTVLGAAGNQGRVAISKRNYSVLDALADSKGLDDQTADPCWWPVHARAGGRGGRRRTCCWWCTSSTSRALVALARTPTVGEGQAICISDAPFTQVKVLPAFRVTMSAGFSGHPGDRLQPGSSSGISQ